jgi:hypothetical protein
MSATRGEAAGAANTGNELLYGWKCRSRVPLSFPSKIYKIEWECRGIKRLMLNI